MVSNRHNGLLMAASRAYEANVTAISESRTIGNATMGILHA